jgi:hypothetical protein
LEKTWKLIVGVVSEHFEYTDEGKYIGYDKRSYGYIAQTGQKIGGTTESTESEYGPAFGRGSRIGVLVDFNRDEISFYKDGQYLGVAFSGFKRDSNAAEPTLYFAVSMIRSGMQVSIVPNAKPRPSIEELDITSSSTQATHGRRMSLTLTVPMPMVSVGGSSPYPAGELAAVNPTGSPMSSSSSATSTDNRRRRRASVVAASEIGLDNHSVEVSPDGVEVNAVVDVFPEEPASPMEDSPPEIKIEIFSHLNHQDLRHARLVSKMWHQLADSDPIWAPTVRKTFPNVDTLRASSLFPGMRTTFLGSAMKFSTTNSTQGLDITNNGHTLASSPAVNYWAAARVDYPVMSCGVHYGEFRIDTYRHGSIGNTWKVVIGVVSKDFEFKLAKWVGVDERSFGYIANNGKRVGPSMKNQGHEYGETYQENDRVGILLDLNVRCVKFFKNGICQGVAFEDGPEWAKLKGQDLYFAVSLARTGMQVTAVKYEFLGDIDSSNFDPRSLMNPSPVQAL